MRRLHHLCIAATAASFGVEFAAVATARRIQHPARHFARAAYRVVAGASLPETGRVFGVDHTTVLNSLRIAGADPARLQQIVDVVRAGHVPVAAVAPRPHVSNAERLRALEERVAHLEQLLAPAPLKAAG